MEHYAFTVVGSFKMQYTYSDQEVQPDADGNDADVEPTEEAQRQLEGRLTECLGREFALMGNVEVFADSDALLGVDDDSKL
jgi:hypothetical protein